MTDLEITKLCAEAMEVPVKESIAHPMYGGGLFLEICTGRDPGNEGEYAPIHDDAQAMALVKKFGLWLTYAINPNRDNINLWVAHHAHRSNEEATNLDLNRAICECIAKMQEAKRGP